MKLLYVALTRAKNDICWLKRVDLDETKKEIATFEELVGVIQRPFTVEKFFEVPDIEFKEIIKIFSP